MYSARHVASLMALVAVPAVGWSSACGGTSGNQVGGGGSGSGGNTFVGLSSSGGGSGSGGTTFAQCTSQGQCVNHACNPATTISGQVFDPAGVNPLYAIAVYVPQNPPTALPQGAACQACDTLYTGGVVAGSLTDADGRFVLQNAPDGTAVPLVVQIGKWRRQYAIDVKPCQDNPLPSLRLPRNATEGDLPQIAVSTGGADSMECLFRRIGVSASEYTSGAGGPGHIHIFQGGTGARAAGGAGGTPTPGATIRGGSPPSATALWTSGAAMQPYDMVILSCEGGETANPNPQALSDYASLGGRVFASHFHYAWFLQPPFSGDNLATWTRGTNNTGNINGVIETTLPNGATFPKGVAMQKWLSNVGALSTAGELPIDVSRHNADVSAANTPSTPWIVADRAAPAPGATQYFSFDMPISSATEQLCGRIVYSDLHVGAASGDYGQAAGSQNIPQNAVTPTGCANNPLSPQEKALEFMIFDLSSCLTPVGSAPMGPVPMGQ
ncbi:MAG TPA: carboxypeptidase regulatory-like domain-containing protein [Polyangiaceae bacterium]|nr:carboxypeptidase regulatory-like domain-containing protein [Polyangiaceae bacterium]